MIFEMNSMEWKGSGEFFKLVVFIFILLSKRTMKNARIAAFTQ